jgi:hypothetical protein
MVPSAASRDGSRAITSSTQTPHILTPKALVCLVWARSFLPGSQATLVPAYNLECFARVGGASSSILHADAHGCCMVGVLTLQGLHKEMHPLSHTLQY